MLFFEGFVCFAFSSLYSGLMGEEITFILSVYIGKSAPQAAESSQSKA